MGSEMPALCQARESRVINDPLSRPLKFGDKEQADAVRALEIRNEYLQIPECSECDGERGCECDCGCETCDKECETCNGTGRDPDAVKVFLTKYPNYPRR